MASFSGMEKTRDPQSGGKIATKRYRTHNTTPYDRPPTSPQLPPKHQNWISDVIFPTTRMIASGAAKIFTSLFYSDDSSSLSSSDSTHASENDDIDDDNYYEAFNGSSCLNEDPGTTSEAVKSINEDDPQLSAQKSDANHVEQLLLEGKFSSQECNKFIQIINSRVSGATDTHDRNLGSDVNDTFSKSVLEARKWLEEKKVGYSPSSYWADASDGSKFILRKQIDNEVGSPKDVAKSYMKYRPPWASPSAEHVLSSPLSSRSQVIRQLLSLPAGEESSSSFKKRSCLVSGSWNIQEEIRKVRSKATEDLLQSSPSLKVGDILASHSSFLTREDDGNKLNSSVNTKTRDPLKKIAMSEMISNVGGNETLNAVEVSSLVSKKTAGELTSSNTGLVSSDVGDNPRLIIHIKDSTVVGEIGNCDVTENVNNYSTSSKAEVGGIIEKIQSQLSDKKGDETVVGNLTSDVENKRAIVSETNVEVPDVHETAESFDNFSQGSGMVNEELPLAYLVKGIAKEAAGGSGGGMQVKQEGKKTTGKYSRRYKTRG